MTMHPKCTYEHWFEVKSEGVDIIDHKEYTFESTETTLTLPVNHKIDGFENWLSLL